MDMHFQFILVILLGLSGVIVTKFTPDWHSLNSRIIPEWYDKAKVGVMMHWGVYSVIPTGNEWFWSEWVQKYPAAVDFMRDHYPPGFTYQDFAEEFNCERFDPVEWAKLFEASGAKYVVLTSKHHDGFTLFPSNYTPGWNSVDVGPHRDLVQDLKTAIKENSNLVFGLYYSLMEWFHPLYMSDKAKGFKTQQFVDRKVWPELRELVLRYQPEVLWTDGEWEALDTYWRSVEFLTWLYNESPVKDSVVVNDRWGNQTRGIDGGVWTGGDNYNPGTLQTHKFENAMQSDVYSWRHRPDGTLYEYRSNAQVIQQLVSTISCNGNFLLNVGPTKYGTIPPVLEDRLRTMGSFLKTNGEAFYESTYWNHQQDSICGDTWYV